MMIFDWQSHSYRAGSGWFTGGTVTIWMGVSTGVIVYPNLIDVAGSFNLYLDTAGQFDPYLDAAGVFDPYLDTAGEWSET